MKEYPHDMHSGLRKKRMRREDEKKGCDKRTPNPNRETLHSRTFRFSSAADAPVGMCAVCQSLWFGA